MRPPGEVATINVAPAAGTSEVRHLVRPPLNTREQSRNGQPGRFQIVTGQCDSIIVSAQEEEKRNSWTSSASPVQTRSIVPRREGGDGRSILRSLTLLRAFCESSASPTEGGHGCTNRHRSPDRFCSYAITPASPQRKRVSSNAPIESAPPSATRHARRSSRGASR